jgi:proline dehydrogenase
VNIINKTIVTFLPLVPKPIVRKFANKYIAGDKLSEAVSLTKKLNGEGILTTMDVLGEGVTNEAQTVESMKECLEVLDSIHNNKLDSNLSLKLTQLGLQIDMELCWRNMKEILDKAKKYNFFVRIDMEDSSCTDDTLKIFERSKQYYPNCGVVVQAYLKRTFNDVKKIIDSGMQGVNFRLCKGIYVEPAEIAFKKKEEINNNFLKVLRLMLENKAYTGIATHDDKLVEGSYSILKELDMKNNEYEFQMLLGVRENLRDKIHNDGHRLRIYVPFGSHWYKYSIRRFKENPSLAGYVVKSIFGMGK